MSQAVAARITGDCTVVSEISAVSSDMSAGKIAAASPSRRAMLAGLLAAPIVGSALTPSAAIGAPDKGEAIMNMQTSIWKASASPAGARGDAKWDAVSGTDRSVWNRAYDEYRRLKLRMDAYYALGPMKWANEAHDQAKFSRTAEPDKFEKAVEALHDEEAKQGRYYKPADAAALNLVRMPAPDLDAVATKIKLHEDHLVGTDNERVAWACIEDDLRRLEL